jgi:hypothetical protein
MKTAKIITGLIILLLIIFTGCKKKKEEKPQLSNSYYGTLYVEYTKGFPAFSIIEDMDVYVSKDATVTFGPGETKSFDKEETSYESGKPVLKIHMKGSMTFHEASGEYFENNGQEYLLILVHMTIQGQMTVWSWDEDLGWILFLDEPIFYEDTYDDGTLQFSIPEAVMGGDSIKQTIPDYQGTFTYGYTLNLIVGL